MDNRALADILNGVAALEFNHLAALGCNLKLRYHWVTGRARAHNQEENRAAIAALDTQGVYSVGFQTESTPTHLNGRAGR